MKKILFDCIALQPSQGKYHGGGEYAKAVLYKLIESGYGKRITCFFNGKQWIDENIISYLKKNKVDVIMIKNDVELQLLIDNPAYGRIYSALPNKYYKFNLMNIEFYYTMHALRDFEIPTDKYEFFLAESIGEKIKYLIKNIFPGYYRTLLVKRTGKLFNTSGSHENRKIFVDSLHSKFSLASFFPEVDHDSMILLYPPIKKILSSIPDESSVRKYGIGIEKYILIVSGNRWIKNPCRALKAIDKLNFDLKVIITGTGPGLFDFLKLKHKERYIFIDYVDDATLEYLYKNAYFLLYPTLHEGFGYPPLEAMKYGTPVIGSAVSCLTEIYGDSMIYFNPFSVHEIENRIHMFYADKEVRDIFRKRALKKSKEIMKKQEGMLVNLCELIIQ